MLKSRGALGVKRLTSNFLRVPSKQPHKARGLLPREIDDTLDIMKNN